MKKIFVYILGIVCIFGLFSCTEANNTNTQNHVSNEISVPSVQKKTETVVDTAATDTVKPVAKQEVKMPNHKISKDVQRWTLWNGGFGNNAYIEILLIDGHEYIAYWTKHGYGGGLGFTHSASCPACDKSKK